MKGPRSASCERYFGDPSTCTAPFPAGACTAAATELPADPYEHPGLQVTTGARQALTGCRQQP
jgi:hypothetical protein